MRVTCLDAGIYTNKNVCNRTDWILLFNPELIFESICELSGKQVNILSPTLLPAALTMNDESIKGQTGGRSFTEGFFATILVTDPEKDKPRNPDSNSMGQTV